MRQLKLITGLIILLTGCSPKIHEHFEQNRYVRNFSIHVVNDSLQLYFKTPADIAYTTDREKLRKIIQETDFKLEGSVLVYGKTDSPPYEYFVTLSNKNRQEYPDRLVVFDTLVNDKAFRFVGNPLDKNSRRNLGNDLKKISRSLEVGSTYRKEISTVMDVVEKYKSSNKFLAAVNEIREFPTYDRQEEQVRQQMELTFSSFLGDNEFYDTHLKKRESRFKPKDGILKTLPSNATKGTAVLDTIVRQAEKHRVVMINENHFFPNHRLLPGDLLERLKDKGYRYLALEALGAQEDSLLNVAGAYPTLTSGFYIREQHFSNLVRKAKKLGYTLVAYENTDPDKDREVGQAENLYNKTIKKDPESKVLVLAGVDHILEEPTPEGKAWMASVFKKKYGIDPLTISQTHINEYRSTIDADYALVRSSLFDSHRLNSTDFLVLNNKDYNWAENFEMQEYQNPHDNEVQVALFYGDEIEHDYDYVSKVPYFTTILRGREKQNIPVDKQGKVYLYALDKNGKRIESEIITAADTGSD